MMQNGGNMSEATCPTCGGGLGKTPAGLAALQSAAQAMGQRGGGRPPMPGMGGPPAGLAALQSAAQGMGRPPMQVPHGPMTLPPRPPMPGMAGPPMGRPPMQVPHGPMTRPGGMGAPMGSPAPMGVQGPPTADPQMLRQMLLKRLMQMRAGQGQ